jgi:hypothetical protein
MKKATEIYFAKVSKTPDGFLALRQAPTASSEIVVKLAKGTFLTVDTAKCEVKNNITICDNHVPSLWTHVITVEGNNNIEGWVRTRYIKSFECGM